MTQSALLRNPPLLLVAVMMLFCSLPVNSDDDTGRLDGIVAGDHRSEGNRARDAYRHPVETLQWFGLRDDMTVVEIFPGGGWYTEIIAPFVNEDGQYYGAGFDPDSERKFLRESARRYRAMLAERPDLYGNAILTILGPPEQIEIAPPGSADMVLTFRNVHNWMAAGTADDVFAAMYRTLKPGGILGLVEHRGDPATEQDPEAGTGYVNQDYAVELAEMAGFVLIGSSEINANPKDTKDYEKGVWTLPPTLALGEEDRERYLAIGESDRMTLKFRKPD